jgi:hypothetical protein
MDDLPENAPIYDEDVDGEVDDDGDLIIYNKKRQVINIYHDWDIVEIAKEHHNRTLYKKKDGEN